MSVWLEGFLVKSYVLSAIVDNNPGILIRVAGLFNRRGYNLDSVTAGVTDNPRISRLTILVSVEEDEIIQIVNQINKLEDVHKVAALDDSKSVCKEMMLVKVKAVGEERQEIINIVNIFRASIVDVTTESFIIEITGDNDKLSAIEELLKPYGIIEIVRSGFIGIERGKDKI